MKQLQKKSPAFWVSCAGVIAVVLMFLLWWAKFSYYSAGARIAALISAGLFVCVGIRFAPELVKFWSAAEPLAENLGTETKTGFLPKLFLALLGWDLLVLLAAWPLRVLLHGEMSLADSMTAWVCGDGVHYLDIARDWYLSEGSIDRLVQLVFLPAYPLLIRLLHLVIPNWTYAALAVSGLCFASAGCLLYKLTGEKTYLTKAQKAADYVISNMCTSSILKFENGYEQGVYTAIYAQYMKMLIYDCGLNKSYTNKYLKHIQRQMQKGWDNRDQERGIQAGNFAKKTESADVVESYGGSGLPALMLMFPAHITVDDIQDDIQDTPAEQAASNSDIYTIDGRLVKKNATHGQVASLGEGLYIYQQKKLLVRK